MGSVLLIAHAERSGVEHDTGGKKRVECAIAISNSFQFSSGVSLMIMMIFWRMSPLERRICGVVSCLLSASSRAFVHYRDDLYLIPTILQLSPMDSRNVE